MGFFVCGMMYRKIAERRWLKEPTQLQWRVTLPSANTTLLSLIKRMTSLLTPKDVSKILLLRYNKILELQYRGRIRELKNLKPTDEEDTDLFKAMTLISKTNKGPNNQSPSMGCNIKWYN